MNTLTRDQIDAMTLPELRIAVADMMETKPPPQDVKTLRSMVDRDWRFTVAYLYSTGEHWRVNVGTSAEDRPEWEPFYDYPSDIEAAWLVHKVACAAETRKVYFTELQRIVSVRVKGYAVAVFWPDVMAYVEPQDICRAALVAAQAAKGETE